MTDLAMLAITFTVLQIIVVTYLMRQIWDLESDVDRLEKYAHEAVSSQRDSYYELSRKHDKLLEALEMETAPIVPAHYRRKGNYD